MEILFKYGSKEFVIDEQVVDQIYSEYGRKFNSVKISGQHPFTEEYLSRYSGDGKLFKSKGSCLISTTNWYPLQPEAVRARDTLAASRSSPPQPATEVVIAARTKEAEQEVAKSIEKISGQNKPLEVQLNRDEVRQQRHAVSDKGPSSLPSAPAVPAGTAVLTIPGLGEVSIAPTENFTLRHVPDENINLRVNINPDQIAEQMTTAIATKTATQIALTSLADGAIDAGFRLGLQKVEAALLRTLRHQSLWRRMFSAKQIRSEKAAIAVITGVVIPYLAMLAADHMKAESIKPTLGRILRSGVSIAIGDVVSMLDTHLSSVASAAREATQTATTEEAVVNIFNMAEIPVSR